MEYFAYVLGQTQNLTAKRFIQADPTVTGGKGAKLGGVSTRCLGITAPISKAFNNVNVADTIGDPFVVTGAGVTCELILGGTVAEGDELESDVNGAGVVAAGAGQHYIGAIAMEAGVAGNAIQVLVTSPNQQKTI